MTMPVAIDTPLIPKKALFGNPTKAGPQISPDGTKLLFHAPVNGVLNVWVGPVTGEDSSPVTNDTDRGIRMSIWSRDSRSILYLQDVGGDENWRLFISDLETGETRDLTPFEGVRVGLLKMITEEPDRMLISMNKDNPELHDVYRIRLSTGEMEKVAENPGDVISWTADQQMNVRGAVAMGAHGMQTLRVRETVDSDWNTVLEWGPEDSGVSGPVSFHATRNVLYCEDSRDANTGRFVEIDLATGEVTVIAQDDTYDVSDYLLHKETREPQMIGFFGDRLTWHVLDDSLSRDIDNLRHLHHGDFRIMSRDDDDNLWVVEFNASDAPLKYYLYDRRSGAASFLFDARPDLADYPLAQMEPFSYTTRDGLTVHGYLTFPLEGARNELPLVLNVHGGPWHRDWWGYNPEAQWLANRGYICMQVNFRGSTGYGKSFMNAANKEWGGKMHDDLVDAVRWAADNGCGDPNRVAIYGGSYGGYAALVGATFTPDLFKCAVDIVGPSNLITFIETIPPYWRPQMEWMRARVGDPETEVEFLKSRSPLFRVDEIKIPMLIAQGANDPRVKQSESEQIVAAMKEKGIPHKYMLFPDEGHGFAKPENRMKFYGAAEAFLAEHLGGRTEEEL